MEYEGQICRAPMERASFMLPIMVGCSYNRCKFCNLFRHLKYRELPLTQVEEELARVKRVGGSPKRVFLGDGNAFAQKNQRLLQILEMVQQYFPECEEINMDATVTSILRRSDDELHTFSRLGVRHLYLGIESGLDDVLIFMEKDHNQAQAYEAIKRLKKAGMIFDAHIMTGVAGKGRGKENARALAEFLNQTQPAHVVNFSMFLHKEVPLYQNILEGSFIPSSELENLEEERCLLELLDTEILYDGFHDFIRFRVRGKLPKDKEKMLLRLDEAISRTSETEVYSYVQGECPALEKCDGGKVWKCD
ncbi:radical SAM protein [Sporofaciens musculi]|uniref:radical SAM protein n=1 Tax=Sporofaciens musculi TaxID=2681861 RepID=UPI002170C4FC|nr:radical SAM protein [Sporofaciens musculi]MCI9421513.1 radical SAM protein [Dorea sp.]